MWFKKWTIDINGKYRIIKLLEDRKSEFLDDLGYGNDFLGNPKSKIYERYNW